MIASRPERWALGLLLAALGCVGPTGLPAVSAIDPASLPLPVPDVADRTAARLAAAALVARGSGDREVRRALRSLESIDTVLWTGEEKTTGLLPAARELAHASLDDHRAYRRAASRLLREPLDPAMEQRIQQFRDDAPLARADARIRDARQIQVARAFNTLAEPAGRSMMNWSMAPYRFGQAALNYAIQLYQTEPLSLQRRQALAHWKEFVARHPEDPRTPELRRKIEAAQARWNRTHYLRSMRSARQALKKGQPRLALVMADRALAYLPEDPAADELLDEAGAALEALREERRRSVASPAEAAPVAPPEARGLALALLGAGDVAAEAEALLASAPEGPLADEARFALASAAAESGEEQRAWAELAELADEPSNMARHAEKLLNDPYANPHAAFRDARRRGLWRRVRFALLGPWANGPPERGLPELLEWPLGITALGETGLGLPLRLIQLPWMQSPGAERAASYAARRYLKQRPDGAHAEELREWLIDFEGGRGNWLGALALEEERGEAEAERLAELREKAAGQSLSLAAKELRPGLRIMLLQRVARDFQGAEAAREAGFRAREETLRITPQRIQLSRPFLEENPELAGIAGLALRPQLLDGETVNGEIHPDGVAFVGGRELEVALVAPGSDEDDPPQVRVETLDDAHLARVVALLEETSFRNALLDSLEEIEPDSRRDRFFEQARLGRSEVVDRRPGAGSRFAYRGLRERYGMVRHRESILPFDLVVQGSFDDLSLGAFPRLREPRETPDAIFYK